MALHTANAVPELLALQSVARNNRINIYMLKTMSAAYKVNESVIQGYPWGYTRHHVDIKGGAGDGANVYVRKGAGSRVMAQEIGHSLGLDLINTSTTGLMANQGSWHAFRGFTELTCDECELARANAKKLRK